MALGNLVTTPDDLKRTMGVMPPMTQGMGQPPGPEPTGALPSLGTLPPLGGDQQPSSLPMGGLKPIVTNPQDDLRQQLQQQVSKYYQPAQPKGFWGKLGHALAQTGAWQNSGTMDARREQEAEREKQLTGIETQQREDKNAASEAGLRGAQTANLQSETRLRDNPPTRPDKYTFQQTDHGLMRIDQETGEATLVTFNGQPLNPFQKESPDARGMVTDLNIGGKEHNVLIDPTSGRQIADLGLKGEKPPTANINFVSPGDNGDLVKGIGEYRIAPPNPRTAQGAAILRQVAQQYPDYDASQYESQVKNRANLTSGRGALVINALNTVADHIKDARQNMPQNTNIPAVNTIKNLAQTAMGQAPTKKWDVDADAIGGEWSKLVSGGVATEGELNHIKTLLNNADSPKAMKDALDEIDQLTQGKLAGIKKQYGAGALEVPARGISSIPGETRAEQTPPASVVNTMKEGQYVHGPGGSYQKKGGKLVPVANQ